MNMNFRDHLPSRREALIGSGALFAWTQMPKLADTRPQSTVASLSSKISPEWAAAAGNDVHIGKHVGALTVEAPVGRLSV
jgi:hypothetical protein